MPNDFLARIDPFLELDITKHRHIFLDHHLRSQCEIMVREALSPCQDIDQLKTTVTNLLTELVLDVHMLKCAYIEKARYLDPKFDLTIPTRNTPPLDKITLDFRGDVVGANWWSPEPHGRWAGPESESSIILPTLGSGRYRVEIQIADVFQIKTLDQLEILFNGEKVEYQRSSPQPPTTISFIANVIESTSKPFSIIKLRFPYLTSPKELGQSSDERKLAVFIQELRMEREGGK